MTNIQNTNYMALPGLKPGICFSTTGDPISIIEMVCNYFDVSVAKILKKGRRRENVIARQVSMYFIKRKCNISLKRIGELFGSYDHTTVIHSINTVNDLIFSDPDFKAKILLLENKLS